MGVRFIERNMFYREKGDIFEVAKMLRKNMTKAELILWKRLKNRDLYKYKFRRQHPVDIFIIDFYCHEIKLAVEIDGDFHSDPDIKNNDFNMRFKFLKNFSRFFATVSVFKYP